MPFAFIQIPASSQGAANEVPNALVRIERIASWLKELEAKAEKSFWTFLQILPSCPQLRLAAREGVAISSRRLDRSPSCLAVVIPANKSIAGAPGAGSAVEALSKALGVPFSALRLPLSRKVPSLPTIMKPFLISLLWLIVGSALHAATFAETGNVTVDTRSAPTVASPQASSITETRATLGGNVSSDNGAAIAERGVVYSAIETNNDPLISGTGVTKVIASGTTGVFTSVVNSLTPGKSYSYKAYAINSLGTSYTSLGTFTTNLSTNADLSALTLSSVTLTPPFASGTIAYIATVSNATTSINVTPTRAQANATIEVRVNGGTYAMATSGLTSAALPLNVGTNTLDVRVTAQDGVTQKTYGVTLYNERDVVIAQQPQLQEVAEQSEARFSVHLHSGGEFATYQWFRNNQLLPGAASSELVLPSVLLSQSGNYHVVIASPYDNETSASAPLVVRILPEIKQQPNSVMVNVGDSTNYAVSVLGRPELTYQWRRNGSDIAGAQSRSFAINTTTMAQAGRYQVRIKNPANPAGVLSAEAELGVVEAQGSLRLLGMPHSKILKLSVVAAGNGLSYRWHRNGSEVTANARIKGWDSKDLTVENISDADNGDYQCRVTGPGGAAWGVVTRVVVYMPPVITQEADSMMANVGDGAGFGVLASGEPMLTYQWRHNGKILVGSQDNSHGIESVTLANAGRYQLTINNPPNAIGILSREVELGVVESSAISKMLKIQQSKGVKLAVTAAGNGLAYLWHRNDVAVASTGRNKGWDTRELTLENLSDDDEGEYKCRVTGPGGIAWGAVTTVKVFNLKPKIQRPLLMDDAMVGKSYEFTVPLDLDNGGEATSYTATGLPPGLKIDATTGIISGKPTAAKADGYFVKISAINSLGRDEETVGIVVAPLRPGTAGTYAAIVRATGWQDFPVLYSPELCGRLDLMVLSTAAYSGSLTLGGVKFPLTGVLDADAAVDPTGQFTVKRKGKPDIQGEFTLIPDSGKPRQLIGAITGVHETRDLEILGWRQTWSSTVKATAYDGIYNIVSDPDLTPDVEERLDLFGHPVPRSAGYLNFTVGLNGVFNLVGRTGDGERVTCSGFLSEPYGFSQSQAPLYAYISATKGCLAGQLSCGAESSDGARDNGAGTLLLSWNRAPGGNTSRLYKAGFNSVSVSMSGGQYVPPTKTELLLDSVSQPLALNNAKLDFDGGGAANQPAITFSILADGKLAMPTSASRTTLSITAATGMFKGSFVLTDLNPFTKSGIPQSLTRTVSFEGLIVPDRWINAGLGKRGYGSGFFVLPQMPTSVNETLSNSPILGGRVTITNKQ